MGNPQDNEIQAEIRKVRMFLKDFGQHLLFDFTQNPQRLVPPYTILPFRLDVIFLLSGGAPGSVERVL